MNRRDLLKQAGALAVGLPALRASGLARPMPQSGGKDLVVSFAGPFCFWAQDGGILVMAPAISKGQGFNPAHQAWIATNQNEAELAPGITPLPPLPEYTLAIPGSRSSTAPGGTPIFTYPQEGAKGKDFFFTVLVPNPDIMVGTRSTYVTLKPRQAEPRILAAGLTLLYQNVDLGAVQLNLNGQKIFTPCFDNDKDLPAAMLGIHLAQINQTRGQGHAPAKAVWGKMMAMFKWLEKDFGQIDFPPFDITHCPPVPVATTGAATRRGQKGAAPLFGPGNDCEVPIMMLQGIDQVKKKK